MITFKALFLLVSILIFLMSNMINFTYVLMVLSLLFLEELRIIHFQYLTVERQELLFLLHGKIGTLVGGKVLLDMKLQEAFRIDIQQQSMIAYILLIVVVDLIKQVFGKLFLEKTQMKQSFILLKSHSVIQLKDYKGYMMKQEPLLLLLMVEMILFGQHLTKEFCLHLIQCHLSIGTIQVG